MRKRRDIAKYNGWWGDAQKLEAVQTYLVLGSIRLTSTALEIPEKTLITWRQQPWWQEITDELRLQDKLQLSQKLKDLVEASIAVSADRIKHGDFVKDHKTGKFVRKPVDLKDAHRVSLDMMNKRDAILSSEKVILSDAGVDKRLKDLAERFADMAMKKIEKQKKTPEVTDVIFIQEEKK